MFQNREDAGCQLAVKLNKFRSQKKTIVFVILRGGLIIGYQIVNALNLPLQIIAVKKLRAPNNQELAIGAITSEGEKFIYREIINRMEISQKYIDEEASLRQKEVKDLENTLGIIHQEINLTNEKTVILVDDGVATGATVITAKKYLNSRFINLTKQYKIILAVPVIAKDTYDTLQSEFDEIIALEVPESFGAVGEFYREFSQITNKDVIRLLLKARHEYEVNRGTRKSG